MGRSFEFDADALKTRPVSTGRRWQMSIRGLMKLVFALALVLALLSLLGRRERPAEHARRAQCFNNLKQIALALHTYHEFYGVLPPAYVADASGRPMHSWRVLLLPFLEQTPLYNRYDFTEPWDGPNNIKLLNTVPSVYICPSDQWSSRKPGGSNYAAITGPGTMFPGAGSVKFADVTDGLASTVMLAEVANGSVPWTAPVDLDARTMSLMINDPKRPGISSRHLDGAAVAFGDGRVYFWEEATPLPRALLTIAGGDVAGGDGEDPRSK